jgi:hypothetical protein
MLAWQCCVMCLLVLVLPTCWCLLLLVLWAVLGRIANAAINRMLMQRIRFLQVCVLCFDMNVLLPVQCWLGAALLCDVFAGAGAANMLVFAAGAVGGDGAHVIAHAAVPRILARRIRFAQVCGKAFWDVSPVQRWLGTRCFELPDSSLSADQFPCCCCLLLQI